MKLSIYKLLILFAILVVLGSISGGLFANAQTEIDKGPAGPGGDTPGSQPISTSSAPLQTDPTPRTSSGPDPNIAGSSQGLSANDPDANAAHSSGTAPNTMMLFKFVAGSAFHPRNSTYTYADSSPDGGCIYQTGGAMVATFVADLQLPDGAIIDIFRQYYYDTSVNDNIAWLTQYDGAGGFLDIGMVASTKNDTGFGSNAISGLAYVVGNKDYPLALNWRSNQIGDTMRLCGMRVGYFAPAASLFMPGANRP